MSEYLMRWVPIWILCFLGGVTCSRLAKAQEVLQPKAVEVEAYQYEDIYDSYLAPVDKELKNGGAFITDFYLVRYQEVGLYWNNRLFFDQSEHTGRIRHAGWQYELGLDLGPKVQLFKQHESRHLMDEYRAEHFPVYDRFGVRMRIWP